MSADITAVVNLHREGERALPSLISAWRSVEAARALELTCELLLVLDRPDAQTRRLADRWSPRGAGVLLVDEGDLGQSRNRAVEHCSSTWVAFLDGDDLWSDEWLHRGFAAATDADSDTHPAIWHPAMNIIFGDHHSVVHHVDSTDEGFSWSRFRLHNQWTALSFARRSDLLAIPYPPNQLDRGFGFEDWSWNEEVLRRGGRHLVVPETCHFIYRSTQPSLLDASRNALRTRYPPRPGATYLRRPTEAPPEDRDAADNATHELTELTLSEALRIQIRRSTTIDPRIAGTIDLTRPSIVLPQNLQRHVTVRHRALHDIVAKQAVLRDNASIADLLELSSVLANLDETDRTAVVAEVLLDVELLGRARGTSALIEETIRNYPQLAPGPEGQA